MRRFLTIMLGLSLFGAVATDAAIIVSNYWEDGSQSWSIKDEFGGAATGSLTDPATLAGREALQIDASVGGTPAVDFVYADGANALIGNWSAMGAGSDPVRSIRFQFYAGAGAEGGSVDPPAEMRLFFLDGAAGNTWYYTLDVASMTSGWNFLYANIDTDSRGAWWRTGGTDGWDIANVTEVGLWLAYHTDVNNQAYGIAQFELHDQIYIPEPGTWLMLGFAFLSMTVTFRKRLEDLAAQAWARVRA